MSDSDKNQETCSLLAAPAAPAPHPDLETAAKAVAADWQKDEPHIIAWDALPEESKEMARHQARVVLNAVAAPVAQAAPLTDS